jgi:hypothetical protein
MYKMEGEFKYRLNYHRMLGRKKSDGNYGSHDEVGSVSISIGFDSPSELEQIKNDLEAMLELDEFIIDRMKDTSKYFIQVITDEEEEAGAIGQPPSAGTPAKGQAEKPSTAKQEPWGQWEPKYPEVDEYLIKECGFTRSKWENSYARLEQSRTVYLNRSKADDKWVCKDSHGDYWSASWGETYGNMMKEIASLTGDK